MKRGGCPSPSATHAPPPVLAPLEFIVADCGSADAIRDVAVELGVKVIGGACSRADALNRGAAEACGDVLLFLHAATLLPGGFVHRIRRALGDPAVAGGAFDFRFAPDPQANGFNTLALLLVILCNRIRFRWSRNFYGDQAIFVRRDVFDRIGGFPRCPLLQDLRFSPRHESGGKDRHPLAARADFRPAVSSSRRFAPARDGHADAVVRQLRRDTGFGLVRLQRVQPAR